MLYVLTGADRLPHDFIGTCATFLPPWRLGQVMQYRFQGDRNMSAAAYLLLVHALRHEGYFHALPDFAWSPAGKPRMINYPGLHFSLSHCRGAVACLLSATEAGIDIEEVLPWDDDLAKAVCSHDEYHWVTAPGDPVEKASRLALLWTRKESVAKMLGTGLEGDPRNIPGGRPCDPVPGAEIFTVPYPGGTWFLSACIKSIIPRIHENQIPPPLGKPERDLLRMGERPLPDPVQHCLSL